ncbi:MAG: AAA family ATPase, partial [Clostridiales Family XIII bacterium]|nr:AAA family ATPase [Clostridiales Family XIII bacterium]
MFVGNKNKIDLGTSSFARVMEEGALYVDKSRFIEHFLNEASEVQLVARQRRLGKSLNMDMLRCFLTDADDNRHLFDGLYIQGSPLWEQANSAPVFLFDFKSLKADTYRIAILSMVDKYIDRYISDPSCPGALKRNYDLWYAQKGENPNGLLLLTEAVHAVTGKKSYLFIDEYDKLLFDAADTDRYEETRQHMTALLSAGMKGNLYLEKALLTGVMRISHEGMLSDLNNITTFDVFRDSAYAGDYGLTEEETDELAGVAGFDLAEARDWYNGIKVDGRAIYNTYGVMSMIKNREFDCYWGNSGTIDKIISLLTPTRERALLGLLEPGNTETVDV